MFVVAADCCKTMLWSHGLCRSKWKMTDNDHDIELIWNMHCVPALFFITLLIVEGGQLVHWIMRYQ